MSAAAPVAPELAALTWTETRALLAQAPQTICLLPVGALEAHGPHLPLGTDVVIAGGIARRAGAALLGRGHGAVVAPPLGYSVTDYAGDFAGTTGVSAPAATAYVADVCLGLRRAGFGRVVLVNAHLEPAHLAVLRAAVARAVGEGHDGAAWAVLVDSTERRFGRTLGDEYRRGECHAGAYETSLVLAERPELVRALRAELPPVPIDLGRAMREGKHTFREAGADAAYFGTPATATAVEGEALYARLVDAVLTVVDETWPPG